MDDLRNFFELPFGEGLEKWDFTKDRDQSLFSGILGLLEDIFPESIQFMFDLAHGAGYFGHKSSITPRVKEPTYQRNKEFIKIKDTC